MDLLILKIWKENKESLNEQFSSDDFDPDHFPMYWITENDELKHSENIPEEIEDKDYYLFDIVYTDPITREIDMDDPENILDGVGLYELIKNKAHLNLPNQSDIPLDTIFKVNYSRGGSWDYDGIEYDYDCRIGSIEIFEFDK